MFSEFSQLRCWGRWGRSVSDVAEALSSALPGHFLQEARPRGEQCFLSTV